MIKLNRKYVLYKAEQFIILMAHLFLLYWIIFALQEGGAIKFEYMMLHFTGIAIYGALLIRVCAFLAKRRYERQLAS